MLSHATHKLFSIFCIFSLSIFIHGCSADGKKVQVAPAKPTVKPVSQGQSPAGTNPPEDISTDTPSPTGETPTDPQGAAGGTGTPGGIGGPGSTSVGGGGGIGGGGGGGGGGDDIDDTADPTPTVNPDLPSGIPSITLNIDEDGGVLAAFSSLDSMSEIKYFLTSPSGEAKAEGSSFALAYQPKIEIKFKFKGKSCSLTAAVTNAAKTFKDEMKCS